MQTTFFIARSFCVILFVGLFPLFAQSANLQPSAEEIQSLQLKIAELIQQGQSTTSDPILQSSIQNLQKLQELLQNQQSQTVGIISVPSIPKPYEKTLIHLQGLGTNLNTAYITWTVNGIVRKQGLGEKTLDITLGKAGTTSDIEAIVETGGVIIHKHMTLQPTDIDLIWEASSYTPPFYEGKALYTAQGQVTITALPNLIENGLKINARNLVYKWSQDNQILSNLSGYGQNTLVLSGSIILRPLSVSVEVSSPSGLVKASKQITINPVGVKVLLYEDNPLNGIRYNEALGKEFMMTGKEVTFIAMPFFFALQDKQKDALSHTWTVNNKKIEDQSAKSIITFRRPEEVGISRVSLGIKSENKILQSAQNTVVIKFNDIQAQ